MRNRGLWSNDQGQNWLDGGAPFYSIYKSKKNVFYAVATIEPKFY
jgi:alpha-methylacyl-CoA racemase